MPSHSNLPIKHLHADAAAEAVFSRVAGNGSGVVAVEASGAVSFFGRIAQQAFYRINAQVPHAIGANDCSDFFPFAPHGNKVLAGIYIGTVIARIQKRWR